MAANCNRFSISKTKLAFTKREIVCKEFCNILCLLWSNCFIPIGPFTNTQYLGVIGTFYIDEAP